MGYTTTQVADPTDAITQNMRALNIQPPPDAHVYGTWPVTLVPCLEDPGFGWTVHALTYIPAGTFMGDLHGRRVYTCELAHTNRHYVVYVDDELAIDMTQTPRDVMAYTREHFYTVKPANLEFVCFPDAEDAEGSWMRVGFRTLRPIEANEELIFKRHPDLAWM